VYLSEYLSLILIYQIFGMLVSPSLQQELNRIDVTEARGSNEWCAAILCMHTNYDPYQRQMERKQKHTQKDILI